MGESWMVESSQFKNRNEKRNGHEHLANILELVVEIEVMVAEDMMIVVGTVAIDVTITEDTTIDKIPDDMTIEGDINTSFDWIN